MNYKKSVVIAITCLLLGVISYVYATQDLSEVEKGKLFIKEYKEETMKHQTKEQHDNQLKNIDELNDKIARYKAYSKAFGVKLTEEQAVKKVKEKILLEQYAKQHDIYPTKEEISKRIEEHKQMYVTDPYPVAQGMIEELDITVDEFFYEFLYDGYVADLVRLKIIEHLKSKHPKQSNESEQDYHERMIQELDHLVQSLENA